MQFDSNKFLSQMGCVPPWNTVKTMKSQEHIATDRCEYTGVESESTYWTWKPDYQEVMQSIQQPGGGLVVSCKLEHYRAQGGNDRIVLTLFFAETAALVYGSAILQINDEDPAPTGLVTAGKSASGQPDSAVTVSGGLYSALWGSLKVGGYGSSNDGRQDFPNIAKKNIDAISASIVR